MAVPEFTGEASLYRSSRQYQAMASRVQPNGVAIPQQGGLLPLFHFCYPQVCVPGGVQRCCYWTGLGWNCSTRYCPPPNPCAHCSTPEECCICNGGTWTGKVCF